MSEKSAVQRAGVAKAGALNAIFSISTLVFDFSNVECSPVSRKDWSRGLGCLSYSRIDKYCIWDNNPSIEPCNCDVER